MEKLISLIKTCMTDNMDLFKVKSKKQTRFSKIAIPVVLMAICFSSIGGYANMLITPLAKIHLEYVLLTLFALITSIMTFAEGIYKSSNLLFNCRDDNLLLSLPIKKSTVVFIRIFKFYVFEVLYNSLFFLPAMVIYAVYVKVSVTYYIVSIVAIFLLPVIPVVFSCLIGGITSAISSIFKFKNIVQIISTSIVLLLVLAVSFNLEKILMEIAKHALDINEIICKIYYPIGVYIKLVTNFNIQDLMIFIILNVLIFSATIFILSKIYFKINSKMKIQITGKKKKIYKINANNQMVSFIKKEINRFINSPVFVINAAFGLVLFIIGCIVMCLKFDSISELVIGEGFIIELQKIKSYIPVVLFGFICFSSLTASITSSMISLEGKTFNILKTLPIKPFKIILSKVITATLIVIPCILIGDIIMFIKFKFDLLEIILIICSSIILPLVSETIGIIINLKFPRMNAENDTEVVKQSMSSNICVFIGMILIGITFFGIYQCIKYNVANYLIILFGLIIYTVIYIGLLVYLKKVGVYEFNNINV